MRKTQKKFFSSHPKKLKTFMKNRKGFYIEKQKTLIN